MGRPKKEKPNKQGLYEVKVTIGKKFDGTLMIRTAKPIFHFSGTSADTL